MKETYFSYHRQLMNYHIYKRDAAGNATNQIVPKFIPYWSGLSVEQIKIKYYLERWK